MGKDQFSIWIFVWKFKDFSTIPNFIFVFQKKLILFAESLQYFFIPIKDLEETFEFTLSLIKNRLLNIKLTHYYPDLSKDSMSILSRGRRPALCMRENRHTIF